MSELRTAGLIRRGRCHLVGDDVSMDDIIPQRCAAARVMNPALLLPHLFEAVDPALAGRIQRGDIVLAGRNFASGKPRAQGFIAMGELQLAVVCTSMPYRMLRRAVARAMPVVVGLAGPGVMAASGDEIEIDFAAGTMWNLTRDMRCSVPVMPTILRDIVTAGGAQAKLRHWLATHPEQAIEPR